MRLLHVLPHVRERLASGSVYYAPPLASQDFDYDSHMVACALLCHTTC